MTDLITYPNPILRKKIQYDHTLDDRDVIAQLYEAAHAEQLKHEEEVVGIAANQIGIETRIMLFKNAFGTMIPAIDPYIVWEDRSTRTLVEGCGSLPGYFCEVIRPRSIMVGYYESRDRLARTVETLHGWPARFFYHELDHLNGILILDREPDLWDTYEHRV